MLWLGPLVAIALVVAVVALTGARPRGARPVERGGLMTIARIVVVALVALVAWAVWSQR